MPTLVAAKNCLDWHCSIPVQIGVAAFIAEGHLAHHVRKMRDVYRQRRRVLLSFLHQELGQWLDPVNLRTYGMHVAAMARTALDLERARGGCFSRGRRENTHPQPLLSWSRDAGGTDLWSYGAPDVAQMNRGSARAVRRALEQ